MILERLDSPKSGTTYYIPNNNENDMPNCTKYCHDRAQEACENTELKLFKDIGVKGFPMADKWLEYSILPTGNDPKVGSIACFSGTLGSIHVAYLERQNADGTWLISDSRSDPDKTLRNERYWRLVDNVVLKVGQIPTISGVGQLLGFQYLPISDIRTEKDSGKSQIEIIKTKVRCRSSYGLSSQIVNEGCYVPAGIYDVLETHESDGYIWCRVDESKWVAHDEKWSILSLVSEPVDEFENVLSRFVNSMREEHEKTLQVKQGLNEINQIIERIMKL